MATNTNRVKKTVSLNGQKVFEIIKRPLVTEKSTLSMADNRYTFIVHTDATKPEIKAAVENLFKVKVESVSTLKQSGKSRRFRGVKGKRQDFKKAIVGVAQGQTIDVGAGF